MVFAYHPFYTTNQASFLLSLGKSEHRGTKYPCVPGHENVACLSTK